MPATGSGTSRTTRATTSARVDLARAMVSSDNSVYAQLTKLVGPKAIVQTAHALGIRSELDTVLLDRARRGCRQPARHDARVCDVREPRRPRRRFVDEGSTQGRRARRVRPHRPCRGESARRQSDDDDGRGRPAHLDPAARRHPGHRQAGGPGRPARCRQDGHDRQLRRCVVRRLHPAARRRRLGGLPRQAEADADRVRRQARRGRHAPRSDLEGVHDGGRQAARSSSPSSSRRRRTSRPRRSGSSGAAARTSSTTATAPALGSSPTSPAAARRRRRSAMQTRSPCRS